MERMEYSVEEAGEEVKKKSKNKKRFSDEQVKYLESVFESESKLEPRKKEEVAVELGMQPRQVAIWFQNKRARWKSKQIEQDYKALRASYDALTSRFESLKNEKQSLLAQLQQMGDMLEKPGGGGRGSSSSDGRSDAGEVAAKLSYLEGGQDRRLANRSDEDDNKGRSHHQEGPPELPNRSVNGDVSMETNGKWFGYGSGGLYDQSCNISQLWDFWSS